MSSGTLTEKSDSSKSVSSKSESQRSHKTNDEEDHSISPIDIECHIQIERITKILDGLISRTKMALCIPTLVEKQARLARVLSSEHLHDVLYIVEQYQNDYMMGQADSCRLAASIKDLKTGGVGIKNRLNPELDHVLYIIKSYPALQKDMDSILLKMLAEHQKKENPCIQYLLVLQHFRNLMIDQVTMTAVEDLKKKLLQRKLENSNASLNEKINNFAATISQEKQAFDKIMREKNQKIAELEQELNWLTTDIKAQLNKQILDSNRQMVLASREHDAKNQILEYEEQECENNYKMMLKNNIDSEKNQRVRRLKVETQLVSWLQKYDNDMSEKQLDCDEYRKMHKEECEKLAKVEVILAEQNIIYAPLMVEREAQYHAEMDGKMHMFLLEHAARIIQVAWRTTLENRAAKKRLKKIQKKMKATLEKVERKRELMEEKRLRDLRRQAKLEKKNANK